MTSSFDVLVVGAGLAGLDLARRLASRGLAVALADRKPDVDHGIHTTGIFVRKSIEDFAFPPGSLGPPIRRVTLVSPGGATVSLLGKHDEFRVGRMDRLYRSLKGEAISAGVHWLPGHTFVGAVAGPGHSSVATLSVQGRWRTVEARFLVAADGARSAVAESLGLALNREWIVGVEEVWRGVRGLDEPGFWCWIDPVLAPGYLGWLIADGEEVHVGTGGYRRRFDPGKALVGIRDRAFQLLDWSRAERVERRGGLIPVGGVLERLVSPRGLLIGDAAGAPSPLTAGGLDPCLRLAEFAGDIVPDWLRTGDWGPLSRYDGRRFRGRFASRILMRRAFAGLSSVPLIEAAFFLLKTPPGRAVAHHVFFGRGSFPDLPRPALPSPSRRLGSEGT